jgi:hypothetical protein
MTVRDNPEGFQNQGRGRAGLQSRKTEAGRGLGRQDWHHCGPREASPQEVAITVEGEDIQCHAAPPPSGLPLELGWGVGP